MEDKFAIELVPHDERWVMMAADETARLKDALGDLLVLVHHMGSTAIPGIKAKPIVDMIPVVADLAALDARADALRSLGYEYLGELGIARRRYCRRRDPVTGKRLFQLHCFAQDDPEIVRHIAFRDYLRAHPVIARDYEAQKESAAALHPDDVLAYNDAKNDWIKRTEAEALRWWPTRPPAP